MHRSEVTVDLGALRRNVRTLLRAADGAQLWAVVKANAYGHGMVDAAGAALGAGASGLCVATIPEGLALRDEFHVERILALGPASSAHEVARAREAGLELAIADEEIPEGVRVHLKLETGMNRYGLLELPAGPGEVVGVMTHLATADSDQDFARKQLARFEESTREHSHLLRHAANSAATLRLPESHFDAVRCGVAMYGLSPFNTDPADDGLEPVLSWHSFLAHVKQLQPGESTGYGRRFVADDPTWIGIVPVGYADGFTRDLSGTEVRVGGELCPVVGTISMDSFAVRLPRELPVGTPVVLLGHGVLAERHADVAGTINYEVVCRVETGPQRARRTVVDG
jgi:alanine racemase